MQKIYTWIEFVCWSCYRYVMRKTSGGIHGCTDTAVMIEWALQVKAKWDVQNDSLTLVLKHSTKYLSMSTETCIEGLIL